MGSVVLVVLVHSSAEACGMQPSQHQFLLGPNFIC